MSLTVTPERAHPGGRLWIHGSAAPNSVLDLRLDGEPDRLLTWSAAQRCSHVGRRPCGQDHHIQVMADVRGAFKVSVKLPTDLEPGQHWIEVVPFLHRAQREEVSFEVRPLTCWTSSVESPGAWRLEPTAPDLTSEAERRLSDEGALCPLRWAASSRLAVGDVIGARRLLLERGLRALERRTGTRIWRKAPLPGRMALGGPKPRGDLSQERREEARLDGTTPAQILEVLPPPGTAIPRRQDPALPWEDASGVAPDDRLPVYKKPQIPTLALSAWPMVYHDPRLSANVDDLNLDGKAGPNGPYASTAAVKVGVRWQKSGVGQCIGNVTVGTNGWLYYMANESITRRAPESGDVKGPTPHLEDLDENDTSADDEVPDPNPDGSGSFVEDYTSTFTQPIIVRSGTSEWVFAPMLGRLYKFDTLLNPIGEPLKLEWTRVDEEGNVETNRLFPAHAVLSPRSGHLVFVAQGSGFIYNGEPNKIPGTVLYVVSPKTNQIVTSLDIAADLGRTPEQVSLANTAAIGPNLDDPEEEIVYVLIDQQFLLAYRLRTVFTSGGASTTIEGRKWPIASGTALYDPLSIQDQPGFYRLGECQTSPTLSADGAAVYIVDGPGLDSDVQPAGEEEGEPPQFPRLIAFDTRTGARIADVELVGSRGVGSSVVAAYDTNRSCTVVYLVNILGAAQGFAHRGASLELVWQTHPSIIMLGSNGGKVGDVYYGPFATGPDLDDLSFYVGGFMTAGLLYPLEVTPNWRQAMPGPDYCTRSFNYTSYGKAQAFFAATTANNTWLYAFEQL